MTNEQGATVHLVFSTEGLCACEPRRQPSDPLVLIEDGVYALTGAQLDGPLWVVEDDLALRGLDSRKLPADAQSCSYGELVALIARCNNTVSWR